MRTVNWVIDKYLFDEYEDRLATAIKNSGMKVRFYDDSKEDSILCFLSDSNIDDIMIFHGSLQHGKTIERVCPLYPGVYLTLDNYECFKYYGEYGDYLLNSNYMMMGLNDVLRSKDRIFDTFKTDSIFIRPSNGFKSFPGQTLPLEKFELEFHILTKSYGGLDMNELVVVSPVQDIEEEYRFIVVDGNVVAGSLYMDKLNRPQWKAYYDKQCEDDAAWRFAIRMAFMYQPDKAFTIDVCRLATGEYKLIEINSFCCASMYGCNYDDVVKAINELCISDALEYESII